jgi:serine/threonine protein kinase
MLENDFV